MAHDEVRARRDCEQVRGEPLLRPARTSSSRRVSPELSKRCMPGRVRGGERRRQAYVGGFEDQDGLKVCASDACEDALDCIRRAGTVVKLSESNALKPEGGGGPHASGLHMVSPTCVSSQRRQVPPLREHR